MGGFLFTFSIYILSDEHRVDYETGIETIHIHNDVGDLYRKLRGGIRMILEQVEQKNTTLNLFHNFSLIYQ